MIKEIMENCIQFIPLNLILNLKQNDKKFLQISNTVKSPKLFVGFVMETLR